LFADTVYIYTGIKRATMNVPGEWYIVNELFVSEFIQKCLLQLSDGHSMSHYCVVEKLHWLLHTYKC